ncbi:MAG TPA: NBR1-Ig-like domain-containing protein, partial [Anaerolineae bacterium]|nr:NBR1-Ig-like domain-containing protein [Anaerolineae bacterium]
VITEPDDVAARVVGGTTVFRAWRLQNVGTCTWGPGYELAFYGGRPMGSGGVAFESTFPGEPARRNAMTDPNRLIVPEGKPNQVAIVEVQLMTPVTPGIHQSYWRMRNPHGVFFGPIMGVTMEVVRDCAFGIYGAPVINRFEILGVGNVYHPTDPVNVQVDLCQGQNVVTLDYDIINANNFDIVFEDPTGNTQTVSTSDPSGRYSFPVRVLGEHTITLYADNGSCTVQAQVTVDARPCPGEDFALDIILGSGAAAAAANLDHVEISSSIPPDQIIAEWEYPHENVARFILEILKPNGEAQCTSPTTQCDDQAWWNWPLLKDVCEALFCTPSRGTVITRIEAGDSQTASIQMNTSIENLCAQAYTDPTGQSIVFQMLATDAQGFAASPALSNLVVIPCPVRLLPNEITTTSPATEIQTPIPMPTVIQNP